MLEKHQDASEHLHTDVHNRPSQWKQGRETFRETFVCGFGGNITVYNWWTIFEPSGHIFINLYIYVHTFYVFAELLNCKRKHVKCALEFVHTTCYVCFIDVKLIVKMQ